MKTIFLDIDGVLVNRESLRIASGMRAKGNAACIAALNSIIDATDAQIVISSTWRMLGTWKMRDILKKWGVKGNVIGSTPDHTKKQSSGLYTAVERGLEIQAWIDDYFANYGTIDNFVILDDDVDMSFLRPRLVKTNFEIGLTLALAQQAINLLNDDFVVCHSNRPVEHSCGGKI